MIKSTKSLPQQSTVVSIKLDECSGSTGRWLLEPDLELGLLGLCIDTELSLLEDLQKEPRVLMTNPTGFTQQLEPGFHLQIRERVEAICGTTQLASETAHIQRVIANLKQTN